MATPRYAVSLLTLAVSVGISNAYAADRITGYTYHAPGSDGAGQVATMDGPRVDVTDITNYAYDASGNLTSVTNPLGHVTQYSDYNGRGLAGKVTDANGVETLLEYHVRGWLTKTTVKDPGGNSALDAVTIFDYDAVGQITRITLPDSSYLDFEYDAAQRLEAIQNNLNERIEYTLDNAGNRTQEVIKNSSGTIVKTKSQVFDELSRLMQDVGASNQITDIDYDKNSNPTQVTDPKLNPTGQAYDALNRLITQTDPDNETINYTYDDQDRIKTVTDQRGLVTTYNYNGHGDLLSIISPDTGTTTYQYDEAGNRTQQTDARNIVVDYTYDALNRLTAISYPANPGENVTYSYDDIANGNFGKGRLTQITDQSGQTSFKYDHRNNLIEKTYSIEAANYTLHYSYDLANNLTQITYPSGRIVNYSRDVAGRIDSVTTQANGAAPTENVITGVTYSPFGPMATYTYGNGMTHTVTYDQDYRITDIEAQGVSAVLDLNYGYDPNSNITALNDQADMSQDQTFTYDKLNRLDTAEGSYGDLDYDYDEVGNRTQKTTTVGVDTTTETYTYDANSNRLDQVAIDDGVTQTQRTLQYDDNGNLINDVKPDGTVHDLTYNNANRYSILNKNSTPIATYIYNALGQRTGKVSTDPTQDEHYHYDSAGMLLAVSEPATGNPIREYIYLDTLKVGMLADTAVQNPADIIVDNLDANTSHTGTWKVSSAPNAYSSNSVYDNGNDTFRWTPTIATAGTYQVYAWWTYHSNRSNNVPYTISYQGGSATVNVDQQNQSLGGQWNLLGTYTFTAGSSHYVEISSDNGQASADAIKLVYGSAPPPNQPPSLSISAPVNNSSHSQGSSVTFTATATDPEQGDLSSSISWSSDKDGSLGSGASLAITTLSVDSHVVTATVTDAGGAQDTDIVNVTITSNGAEIIVDNQDANTSSTGNWQNSSGASPYNGNSVYDDADDTFRWIPAVPSTGTYKVYAWWTYHNNRSSNVPYTISYQNGIDTVTVDQHNQSLGGQWNLLGTYDFTAGSSHYVEVSSANGQASADAIKLVEEPAN